MQLDLQRILLAYGFEFRGTGSDPKYVLLCIIPYCLSVSTSCSFHHLLSCNQMYKKGLSSFMYVQNLTLTRVLNDSMRTSEQGQRIPRHFTLHPD